MSPSGDITLYLKDVNSSPPQKQMDMTGLRNKMGGGYNQQQQGTWTVWRPSQPWFQAGRVMERFRAWSDQLGQAGPRALF